MKRSLLNVGKALNLNKPENHWLAADHLRDDSTFYHLVKKDNGRYLLVSSAGRDANQTIRMVADQSGRDMGYGEIVHSFAASETKSQVAAIKALTGKSSFPFYVYK